MFSTTLLNTFLANLITTTFAIPLTSSPVTPIPPSQDPFYTPSPGFEDTTPGIILRSRPPPSPLTALDGLPLNLKSAYQILYRTNDAFDNAIATVTTVLVPDNANMSRLVSFQEFEDSANVDCAPSYRLQSRAGVNTTLSQVCKFYEAGMLSNGWVVAIPDYEGPQASAFAGIPNGRATLDGLRAVLSSQEITGLAPKDNVDYAIWGYSGGSIPTEFAAEIQPIYAPELDIKAAVIGGSITNLSSSILTINEGVSAGFTPTGMIGVAASYPNMTEFLNANLVSEKWDLFFGTASTCAIGNLLGFIEQDIGSYFKGGTATLSNPELVAILGSVGTMGYYGLPDIPLFFYKGTADEISPVADNDKLVDMYCSQGIKSLRYDRNNLLGSHSPESVWGLGAAIGYITDRFEGVPAEAGCTINNVWISKPDMSTFGGFAAAVEGNLMELLGLGFGSWF